MRTRKHQDVMLAIILSWVYNNTGGSILLAVWLHSSFNAAGALIDQLIPSYSDTATLLAYGSLVVVLLLIVVARGRLSYQGPVMPGTAATSRTMSRGEEIGSSQHREGIPE